VIALEISLQRLIIVNNNCQLSALIIFGSQVYTKNIKIYEEGNQFN